MVDSLTLVPVKLKLFSSITCALIILVVIFADSIISNFSLYQNTSATRSSHNDLLQTHQTTGILRITSTEDDQDYAMPRSNVTTTIVSLDDSPDLSTRFDDRVKSFLSSKECKIQIFMTWISPVNSFGEREFLGVDSLFKTNPKSCLVILSSTMDSIKGRKILKPLIDRGYRVQAISPCLYTLLENTPGEVWLSDIKSGRKNAGDIPLAQNLSNLIRLAALYKYGGLYLDADFIILKDISSLTNSIGAQSIDVRGDWTRLNNAFLVFDKNHSLVYKFMEEFAHSFDGNKWGHNGPYLVSRVINRCLAENGDFNFTILPRIAFYPVDWTRVSGFFHRPKDRVGENWVEAKIKQLKHSSYGVHLWNRQSRKLEIEEGSILQRLVSDHCVVCVKHVSSS